MMYHSPNLFCSQLDTLLSQEDVSLDDILADPSVVDECKAENKTLLAFITQSHYLKLLVEHSVSGPDPTVPISDQFRRCHVASELLSSGVPRISFALLRDLDSLDVLYGHLLDRSLTHLSASFLYRIVSSLIQYSSDEVHKYFAQKSDLSQCILVNIDKPSILDLFYNLVQSHTNPEISLQLSDSTLISDLIGLLSVDQPNEIHASVVQCLCGLLASSRASYRPLSDQGLMRRNRLQEKLESPETIQSIAARIFDPTSGQISSDSLLINGLLYFRCLIDPSSRTEACPELAPLPRNDNFYFWSDRVGTSLCEILLPNLGALKQRLLISDNPSANSSSTRPVSLTAARLHIARFIPYLITAKSDAILREMLNLNLVNVLLDLFFQFPINSFLHSTCECLIRLIVLRAILNSSCSQSSGLSPPSTTVQFSSTDAFHQQFFLNPDRNSPTAVKSDQDGGSTAQNGDTTDDHPPVPEQETNVFWLFMKRLLVEGNLLTRIADAWNTASNSFNRGHMRLIANLLTAVIGPCPEAYEEDMLGSSSDHHMHLITPDHMITVATNGCTNECDSNPLLRSFLRSNLSDDTWTAWCEFVRGPLLQANEKSYVNYTEFPNSVASSEQNVAEYKLTDLAISQALQNAYSNYCSQPLTSAFTDQFGFAEDEFAEIQSHPNLVLDARLSEVNFSLHIHEDTENGSLFEQACNDVIQLNDKEVGLDGICLPEPTTSPAKSAVEPEAVTASLPDIDPDRSDTKPDSGLPSRARLLEVFNEIQSGLNSATVDDSPGLYIDEDANSDDELDIVLVSRPRLGAGKQHSQGFEEDNAVETNVILNGFDHALRLKNLPTLAEDEVDGEVDEVDGVDLNGDGTWRQAERDERNVSSPGKSWNQIVDGIPDHHDRLSNRSGYPVTRRSDLPGNGKKSGRDRRPTPPVIMSSAYMHLPRAAGLSKSSDEADDAEVAKHLTTGLDSLAQDNLVQQNGFSVGNGISADRNNGDWSEIRTANNGQSPKADAQRLSARNGTDMHPSPPAIPLSTWKTHMVLTHQSDSLTPSSPNRLSPHAGITYDPENHPDDMDPIELGDLSAGLSHLARASTKATNVLQSKQLNWTTDRLGGAPPPPPRSLIMPTKRSSLNRSQHEGYINPLCPLNISPGLNDRLGHTSPRLGSSSATTSPASPSLRLSPNETTNKPHSAEYSCLSTHFTSKSSHTSCGILATVKVRHGPKAHNLPPFVISENELTPSDSIGPDDISESNVSTAGDGLNGFEPLDLSDADLAENESSSDPNSAKARYRSHRTIKLRPGSEGQLGELNG